MQTFIELWRCRTAWHELSPEQRMEYMGRIGPEIEAVTAAGVQVLACGLADPVTDHAAEWDLFAVWSAPDAELVRRFEEKIAASGWYDYFEQVNVSGETIPLDALIGRMVQAAPVAG